MDEETKDSYNLIAEEWHKDHQRDDWWVEGTNKFISFLREEKKVLDVGCGGGFKSKYLSKAGLDVTGIDSSEGMIGIAKIEVPEARFEVMSMDNLNTLENNFDGIFAQASLLHIKKNDIEKVLRGFYKKLVDGGYLYVAVKEKKDGQVEEEMKEEDNYGFSYRRFFSYFNLEELKDFITNAGFEIIYTNSKLSGNTTWLQIIAKK